MNAITVVTDYVVRREGRYVNLFDGVVYGF